MTKPTKEQQRACERLVQGLLNLIEASRLNPSSTIRDADWTLIMERLVRIAIPFSADQILQHALERRGEGLKLRGGIGELLMLVETERSPLQILLLDDEAFQAAVAAADESLGEV